MKKIGIVGFGRFGALLAQLSRDTFDTYIIESEAEKSEAAKQAGFNILSFKDLHEVDFIFLAVPISELETVLSELGSIVQSRQVIIDLCSVKVYPALLLRKYIKDAQTLASHPLFGPDSAQQGLEGLQVALCPLSISPQNLQLIRTFWEQKGAVVIETTPEAHDKSTVYSQALTYSIAKVIRGMELHDIPFRTRSFNAITKVAALSANDTDQLFHDMLFYNPYFAQMRRELGNAMHETSVVLDNVEIEQESAHLFTD